MPHKDPEARRAYARAYHLENKAKKNEASRKWYHDNPELINAQRKRAYANNKDWHIAYRLKNKEKHAIADKLRWKKRKAEEIGLDLDSLPEVLSCEICGQTEGRMAFDHNHETGKFRGVLCNHCNVALGMAKDNSKLLQKMIDYLQERGSYSKL